MKPGWNALKKTSRYGALPVKRFQRIPLMCRVRSFPCSEAVMPSTTRRANRTFRKIVMREKMTRPYRLSASIARQVGM